MKTSPTKPHTILWADDDPDDRYTICDIVNAHFSDYEVNGVENGCDVLRFLDGIKDPAKLPCLVVLDINMPKLTGLETLARIKADERFRDLKVAVFTTSGSERDRTACERHGVPMATKPSSYNGFKQAVTDLLQSFNINPSIQPDQSEDTLVS